MAQRSSTPDHHADGKGSALDREAERVDGMMKSGTDAKPATDEQEGEKGLNNPSQIEQDQRNDKARADARAAGGGPDAPESGLNQDG